MIMILLRTIEWLRDTTNASEQEDPLLNKGLNNSFLNYNRCLYLFMGHPVGYASSQL